MIQLAVAPQRPQEGFCVAVVGSRDFADLDSVRPFVHQLPAGVLVLSGGARGVDRCAAAARARGLRTLAGAKAKPRPLHAAGANREPCHLRSRRALPLLRAAAHRSPPTVPVRPPARRPVV
jgi:hypothetical protein